MLRGNLPARSNSVDRGADTCGFVGEAVAVPENLGGPRRCLPLKAKALARRQTTGLSPSYVLKRVPDVKKGTISSGGWP